MSIRDLLLVYRNIKLIVSLLCVVRHHGADGHPWVPLLFGGRTRIVAASVAQVWFELAKVFHQSTESAYKWISIRIVYVRPVLDVSVRNGSRLLIVLFVFDMNGLMII